MTSQVTLPLHLKMTNKNDQNFENQPPAKWPPPPPTLTGNKRPAPK